MTTATFAAAEGAPVTRPQYTVGHGKWWKFLLSFTYVTIYLQIAGLTLHEKSP